MLNYNGSLIVVEDEKISRKFYEELLDQKLKFDFGACQQFESGLTLQRKSSMPEIYKIAQESIQTKSNSSVLYFETEQFEEFAERLSKYEVEFLHEILEFEWGQHSVVFYDLDGHVIDVSETMVSVFRRFQSQGMDMEEIAEKTEHPLEYVKISLSVDSGKKIQ